MLLGQSLQTVVVKVDAVVQVGQSCHPGATADFLAGGLAESRWIREAAVVEDIVGTHTRNSHIDTCKRHALKESAVDTVEIHVAYLIVIARSAIKDVDTHLRRIDAQVKALAQAILTEADVLDIEHIAEEEPSPAEIGAYLGLSVGRQTDGLSVAAQHEVLVSAGYLAHHRKLVVLRLDVIVFRTVEASDGLADDTDFMLFLDGVGLQDIGLLHLGSQPFRLQRILCGSRSPPHQHGQYQ